MKLLFTKYHGLGNDFIVVDDDARGLMSADCAARLCHRHRGVGADGVLSLLPPRTGEAGLRLHIYNADGSVAEMCGNGLRCVAAHVYRRMGRDHFAFDTDAGLRRTWYTDPESVRVSLGTATLLYAESELASAGLSGALAVSLGNPHLVLPLLGAAPPRASDPTDQLPLIQQSTSLDASISLKERARLLGPELERHPKFPERVNVGFPAKKGPSDLELVVFERGAGITQACGTGAAAAVVALVRAGVFAEGTPVTVHLPGGTLLVSLAKPSISTDAKRADEIGFPLADVEITGEGRFVFSGEVEVAPSDFLATS